MNSSGVVLAVKERNDNPMVRLQSPRKTQERGNNEGMREKGDP